MGKQSAQNLRRGVGRIGGSIIDDLNALGEAAGKPGIGTRLAREINQKILKISARQDAQAGFRGSMAVAKQGRKSASGPADPAILLADDRISGLGPGIQNKDAVNLEQLRALFTCDHFGGHVSGFPGWFEDCVGQEKAGTPGITSGIVHAMWGYTYEIPNFTDTVDNDPGLLESGEAFYWEFIVPVATQVDQVTFTTAPGTVFSGSLLPISFALYDMNESDTSFPRVAVSESVQQSDLTAGQKKTLALDTRILILPGRYALAYAGPCFNMICINGNPVLFEMVNRIYFNPPSGILPRFGKIGTLADLPETLDSSNVNVFGLLSTIVPAVYFNDSQEFTEV